MMGQQQQQQQQSRPGQQPQQRNKRNSTSPGEEVSLLWIFFGVVICGRNRTKKIKISTIRYREMNLRRLNGNVYDDRRLSRLLRTRIIHLSISNLNKGIRVNNNSSSSKDKGQAKDKDKAVRLVNSPTRSSSSSSSSHSSNNMR
jgi:hypothetical protein